jgi:hypothetical protein
MGARIFFDEIRFESSKFSLSNWTCLSIENPVILKPVPFVHPF